MIKKIKILVCFFVCFQIVHGAGAQPVVKWDDPYDMDDDDEDVARYSQPNGSYYTIQTTRPNAAVIKVKLHLYNEKGNTVKTTKFKVDGNSFAFIELEGRRYMVTQSLRFSGFTLTAFPIDPEQDERNPDGITLVSLPFWPVGSTVYYQLNSDKTKLFVIEIPGQKKGNYEKWTLKVYDSRLKQLYSRSFDFNYDKDRFSLRQIKVDRNDNLVLTCYLFEKPPQPLSKLPPYQLMVFILAAGTSELKEFALSMPGAMPHQIDYLEHNDNSFTCYGLYGKTKEGFTSGVFTIRFTINGKVIKPLQLREFPANIIEQTSSLGKKRKNEEEVSGFSLDRAEVLSDGRMQFIVEQKDEQWRTYSSSASYDGVTFVSSTTGMQYQYNDIMVFTLSSDPKKDWFTLLRKRQSSFGEKNYLGFKYTYGSNDQLYMLYNDLSENLGLEQGKEPKNLKSGKDNMVTVLAIFDKQGNLTRRILFSKKDIRHWFVPSLTKRQGNYLVLTATSKKTYKMGKLEIE